MPALEPLACVRVVAGRDSLDAAEFPEGAVVVRISPDEALVVGDLTPDAVGIVDEHAIVVGDSGWSGVWVSADESARILATTCEWALPVDRPSSAQGMVAGLPAKLWLESDRTLILVPSALAAEFEERTR